MLDTATAHPFPEYAKNIALTATAEASISISHTLDDLRKVERLQALRDDPSAFEGERKNEQKKLDQIEEEIGKVEAEKQKDTALINDYADKAAINITTKDVSANPKLRAAIMHALVKTYGSHRDRLLSILKDLEEFS